MPKLVAPPGNGRFHADSVEQSHQEALFDAIRRWERRYPLLELAFHVPNEGKRSASYGASLVRAGLKAGVPDVLLPAPRHGKTGLAIELKIHPNVQSTAQVKWQHLLEAEGWQYMLCYGWPEAWTVLMAYVGINEEECIF